MDESAHCYWKMMVGISHMKVWKSLVFHYDSYANIKNSLESKERNSMSQDTSATEQDIYIQEMNLFISINCIVSRWCHLFASWQKYLQKWS